MSDDEAPPNGRGEPAVRTRSREGGSGAPARGRRSTAPSSRASSRCESGEDVDPQVRCAEQAARGDEGGALRRGPLRPRRGVHGHGRWWTTRSASSTRRSRGRERSPGAPRPAKKAAAREGSAKKARREKKAPAKKAAAQEGCGQEGRARRRRRPKKAAREKAPAKKAAAKKAAQEGGGEEGREGRGEEGGAQGSGEEGRQAARRQRSRRARRRGIAQGMDFLDRLIDLALDEDLGRGGRRHHRCAGPRGRAGQRRAVGEGAAGALRARRLRPRLRPRGPRRAASSCSRKDGDEVQDQAARGDRLRGRCARCSSPSAPR